MSGRPVSKLLSVVGLTKTDLMNKQSKYALYISLVYTLSDIRMVVGGLSCPPRLSPQVMLSRPAGTLAKSGLPTVHQAEQSS